MALILLFMGFAVNAAPIESIVTDYTIVNVRNALFKGKPVIIAGSYDGVILCYDYNGKLLWENKLSGFLNQDIYCADLDNDGYDEILTANSDGAIYCLDNKGKQIWKFRRNDAPMSAVTTFKKDNKNYIACGGYDRNLYYLDTKGNMISFVDSRTYSDDKGFGADGPKQKENMVNLLRTTKDKNGKDVIIMYGAINSMSDAGTVYLFEPLAEKPYKMLFSKERTVFGTLSLNETNSKTGNTILLGSTKDTRAGFISELNIATGKEDNLFNVYKLGDKTKMQGFGYRVTQCEVAKVNGKYKHIILFGSNMLITSYDNSASTTETLTCKYSFYDMIKDPSETKLILASSQSGGSCIHIIDLNERGWKSAYEKLEPKGKIASILANSDTMRKGIKSFKLPSWESLDSRPVVRFMSDSPNRPGFVADYAAKVHKNYPSPIFLNGGNSGGSEDPATWNRDTMKNDFYRTRRDRRQKYENTQDQVLANVAKSYTGNSKGMSMWGGHGNDPFYYSLDTDKKIFDLTKKGQETVLIFPEMEGRGEDVVWLMDNLLYPLADKAREKNSKLFIRSKHIFWLGNIYENQWNKVVSGEYADVFVPSMEETTDKSMELSLAGRLGMWTSGSVDSWGSRCARDNTSYNRHRQHSNQMLPNHFLRNMVYHISLGAQYLDNFAVDQEYMSILWDLIAKGILYVPKRDELVCLNPVRLTMLHPTQYWLNEGNNVKWVTFFDEEKEKENPQVFGRLNGSWPAAPVTEWDFSRYAAGATERRLNFISSYNNGHVVVAPPYDANAPRGTYESHLNPIYKGKTKEFFTDGSNYYSDAKMTKKYSATEYYKEVEKAIIESGELLPLTVKGEVGWVSAQSSPKHLRVTIIDGGYLNPTDKEAIIKIGTANVKSITNLVTGEKLKVKNGECKLTVPCGLFVFLDVELN